MSREVFVAADMRRSNATEPEGPASREMEIDPDSYHPPDAEHDQVSTWPDDGITIKPRETLTARGADIEDDEAAAD